MLSGETSVQRWLEGPRDPLLGPSRGRRVPRTEPDPGEVRHRYNQHLFPEVAEPPSSTLDYGNELAGQGCLRDVEYVNHATGERTTLGTLWERHSRAVAREAMTAAALAKQEVAAVPNESLVAGTGPAKLGEHVGVVALAEVPAPEAQLAQIHAFPGARQGAEAMPATSA